MICSLLLIGIIKDVTIYWCTCMLLLSNEQYQQGLLKCLLRFPIALPRDEQVHLLNRNPFPFLSFSWPDMNSVLSLWLQMISVIGSLSLQRFASATEPSSSPVWITLNTVSTELKGECKDSLGRLLLLPTEKVFLERRKKAGREGQLNGLISHRGKLD